MNETKREVSLKVLSQRFGGTEAAPKGTLFTAFDHSVSRALGEWFYFSGVKRTEPELVYSLEVPFSASIFGVACKEGGRLLSRMLSHHTRNLFWLLFLKPGILFGC